MVNNSGLAIHHLHSCNVNVAHLQARWVLRFTPAALSQRDDAPARDIFPAWLQIGRFRLFHSQWKSHTGRARSGPFPKYN